MTSKDLDFMSFVRDKLMMAYCDFLQLSKTRRAAIRRIWNMKISDVQKIYYIEELGIV